jgi:lipopolysaccharide/colanic/teichoic acid biosynthesis glycosyltransferase
VQSRAKRAADLLIASLLLVVSLPIWCAIAVGLKVTTRGPILFRQRRIGLHGGEFTVLKFRTMHHGASEDVHKQFIAAMISDRQPAAAAGGIHKLQDDSRVTAVGRWLRRTSLDELPQLLNVLRGEMSIVGPRPPMAYEVTKYEPWQWGRLAARPGITGLWQVSGRNRLTYRQMCELDVRYIEEWSLLTDAKIVLRTPWVMFVDRGGAE